MLECNFMFYVCCKWDGLVFNNILRLIFLGNVECVCYVSDWDMWVFGEEGWLVFFNIFGFVREWFILI